MYSIVYLCCGSLPWKDVIKEGGIEQYEATVHKKKTALANRLCKGLPLPFITFIQHIQSLGFDEKPQYNYIHSLITQCLACPSNGVMLDLVTILPSCYKCILTPLPHGQLM